MFRGFAIGALLSMLFLPAAVQEGRSLLRVRVVVVDSTGAPRPVPRHVLLISDNPATAAPRKLQTANDGTATVRLPPGNYTVESDRPVTIGPKTYEWLQIIDIVPGRDLDLHLTAANADVTDAASGSSTPDASSLLTRWQDSVFALWSPTRPASGVLVDPRGLIVTSLTAIGRASTVEVQPSPTIKVAAAVLVTDPARDVAVVWMDPKVSASFTPMPLGCADTMSASIDHEQEILALGAPLRREKTVAAGRVSGIEGRTVRARLALAPGLAGGPVFSTGGQVIGFSAPATEDDAGTEGDARVVRLAEVCAAFGSAEQRMKVRRPPDGRPLPVEPTRPLPVEALRAAAQARGFSLTPYRVSSSDYDVTFITPMLMYAADDRHERSHADRTGSDIPDPRTINPVADFSNWSAYVAERPPVLMVRATPKLEEGFWTRIARGAAQTQGVSLPPIKRFKPGFGRLQALCGDAEITPIHAFKLEQRATETEAIYEGLYVFDPNALGPACGTVKLVLYSEQEPGKGDTRTIDPKVVQQVWDDFAIYR